MFKITECGHKIKNYNEYVADKFDDLPSDAKLGDRAIYKDGNSIKIAIKFTDGWVKGE